MKILGTGSPLDSYNRFDLPTWKGAIQTEMKRSGLPGAIQRLTQQMVEQARKHALLMETDGALKQLKKMSGVQE